jgi:peptidoglycan hydrolase CwlO-like protein
MSNFEKKEQNLNQLIDKLNSLSLSYSQPNHEIEKIRTEKNELANKKKEIEKKNEELLREHKYLKEKLKKDA